jgi:N-acetylneuraminic acid mutarotase
VRCFESLERRRLLAVPAAINFQSASAAVPAGYVADTGLAFGDRGGGFQFGWDQSITSATRDRNAASSPDQRYDTFVHTQLNGSRKFEVAVPNGSYTVRLVAGDPNYFNSVYKFNLENVLALSGTPTSGNRWIDNTATVNVSDGRLTLTNASGSSNNKIAFITIAATSPATQTPFSGTPIALPGTIQAEDFDNGGANIAFSDTTSGNAGGQYRSTSVDIIAATDSGGGYAIGFTRPGEWLEYTVNIASAGTFNLELRLASATSGGSLHVEVAGVNKSGAIVVPNTGGWQTWKTLTKSGIALSAGMHVVRLQFDSSANTGGIANVSWLRFVSAAQNLAWTAGPSMPIALGEVGGGIIDNKLYLVGHGNSVTLAYDLVAKSWTNGLAARTFVGDHHAAEVFGGKLYVLGGLGGSSSGKVQIYNPASNSWSAGAAMPFAAGSSSSAVIGSYIYVAGGIIGSATTNRVARYDVALNTWDELAPMPQGRNHAASATDGGKLYVFGGRGPGSGDSNAVANGFNTVQIYDPATNSWQSSATAGSTIKPLPQARGGMGKAVYFNGEFFIIGGETATGAGATADKVYNRVDIYNAATNTWRLGDPMTTARHGIFPLLHQDSIYVAGGGIVAGHSSSSVLEILNAASA